MARDSLKTRKFTALVPLVHPGGVANAGDIVDLPSQSPALNKRYDDLVDTLVLKEIPEKKTAVKKK